jgi:uncharacterized protein
VTSTQITQQDVTIPVDHAVNLGGTLYFPGQCGKYPAITMASGYGGVKEHGAQRFAETFAHAGFVVLLHDHRNFGASSGTPRQDIDPWHQIADWRRAISYLESRPEVAADRIGLWGTGYAGGHALVLGATDYRLRAVVTQVPTISGFEQGYRRVAPANAEAIEESFADDERAQLRGEAPRRIALVSAEPTVAALYYDADAVDFYLQPISSQIWQNSVTLRSMRAARMYEPGAWVERLSPTPLLMIVATEDTVAPADLALDAYERALEPKRLQLIPGGHFDPSTQHFATSSGAAVDWFSQHLN